MVAVPPSGVTRPSSARSVVVFPAPFRPRNPATVPAPTSKLRSSTASTGPNRLVSRCTSITAIAAPSGRRPARSPGRRGREGRRPGPGDLDYVPVGVGDEGVGQPRPVLAPLDQAAASPLGLADRLIDGRGGGLGQVDAEVLDPALLPGPGPVVLGPGQVQCQR